MRQVAHELAALTPDSEVNDIHFFNPPSGFFTASRKPQCDDDFDEYFAEHVCRMEMHTNGAWPHSLVFGPYDSEIEVALKKDWVYENCLRGVAIHGVDWAASTRTKIVSLTRFFIPLSAASSHILLFRDALTNLSHS
jgi:hypothetical protein